MTDNYPGDQRNTEILDEIYRGGTSDRPGGVSNDQIVLNYWNPSISHTRAQIVSHLLNRYETDSNVCGQTINCKSFLSGINFSEQDCLNSLYWANGYADQSGWSAWAGLHQGIWYSDTGSQFEDSATWHIPNIAGQASDGTDYWHQKVEFHASVPGADPVRYGWNQSNANTQYLWGWDPKENVPPSNGEVGAHLGFKHSQPDAEAIFWFTKNECFFEVVAPIGQQRRRISVGLFGRGMWSVT